MTNFPKVGPGFFESGSPRPAAADLPKSVVLNSQLAVNVFNYGAVGNGVTDDATAVSAAVTAANASYLASGVPGIVMLPGGYKFLLGEVTLKSGVYFSAYGAVITPNLTNIPTNRGMFNASTALSRVGIFGGTFLGTGSETSNQQILYTISGASLTDCWFQDMYASNWNAACLYMRNPTRVRVHRNHMVNCSQGSTFNVINFVFDGSAACGGEVMATENIVDAAGADSIAIVVPLTGGPTSIRGLIAGNVVSGMSSSAPSPLNTGAISFENDTTTTYGDVTIANNDVVGYGTDGAILVEGGLSKPHTRVVIIGNRVMGNGGIGIGIAGAGSDIQIVNNRITATTPIHDSTGGALVPTLQTGNLYSTGAAQGRATLVAGTVTVSTAEVQASDNISLTRVAAGGTVGVPQVGTITAGTSFVINSVQPGTASTLQSLDTSTIYWRIDH